MKEIFRYAPDGAPAFNSAATFRAGAAVPFEVAFDGVFSKLEVRAGIHGKNEVRMTLKGGAEHLADAANEINEAIKGAPNYPTHGFRIDVFPENSRLPKGSGDVVVTYTPVVADSGERVRNGSDPQTCHSALLAEKKLTFVDHDLHILACGAYRVSKGFPEKSLLIGTYPMFPHRGDPGDLNEGFIVRTKPAHLRSGHVQTRGNVVTGIVCGDGDKGVNLVVAGALIS